jgi:hypothetical protein
MVLQDGQGGIRTSLKMDEIESGRLLAVRDDKGGCQQRSSRQRIKNEELRMKKLSTTCRRQLKNDAKDTKRKEYEGNH